MEAYPVFFSIIVVAITIFLAFHLRGLSETEITHLAVKRRQKAINSYFAFSKVRLKMGSQGKKKFSVNGMLFPANISLEDFPSTIAALLKYKKHEWIVIGFECSRKIIYFWINKGENNKTVTPWMTIKQIVDTSINFGCSSVIRLHNHPNSDPQHATYLIASKQDMISGKNLGEALSGFGVNFLDFVCERGSFLQFYSSISQQFLPERTFAQEIMDENAKGMWSNLSLHMERIF